MSTEHDLRDAIEELAAEASDGDLLTVSLERRTARDGHATARFDRPRRTLVYAVAGALVVAVVVVAAAVTAGVVRSRNRSEAAPNQGVSALAGVTWTDPSSKGTVVFTATTARVSDGCDAGLYGLTIGAHTLDVGGPIGGLSVCTGTARPQAGPYRVAYDRQQAAVAKFDRVLTGRSTWSRSGATLTVTKAGTAVVFRPSGPAVTLTGEHWFLHQVADHNRTVNGPFAAAQLFIGRDGTVRATDLCNDLSGTATMTITTIDFRRLGGTQRACSVNPKATTVIDAVLSARITYSIANDRLFLYRNDVGDLLVYWLSS